MMGLYREKTTFGLLCLLPFLAFLSIFVYSSVEASKMILLIEGGVFLLLLLLNWRCVRGAPRLVVIALNFISIALTLSLHSGVGAAIAYINLLIAIFVFNNISLTKKQKRTIHLITALLLFLLYLLSQLDGKTSDIKDSLGYVINPNVAGMLFLALLLHSVNFILLLDLKGRIKVSFCVSAVIFVGYLIYLTACRSAMISLLIFVIFLLIFGIGNRKIRYGYYKSAATLMLLFSLLFTVVYIELSKRFGGISVLGKDLFTGRETVWRSAFELISKSSILGNGTDYLLDSVGGSQTSSAHNTLLSIWYTLGIIPTATVIFFFVNRAKGTSGKREAVSVISLMSSLIISFFESFYADPTLSVFFVLFLITNVRDEEQSE